jgi:hypothetical protein
MRNLFIVVLLAGTTLMACTLFGDDPTQTAPDDQASELADRGHGHHHRDAGTDGPSGVNDAGVVFPDGAPPNGDAGFFPDGAPPNGDAGFFPDGAPSNGDAGGFPDGGPYGR